MNSLDIYLATTAGNAVEEAHSMTVASHWRRQRLGGDQELQYCVQQPSPWLELRTATPRALPPPARPELLLYNGP